VNGRRGLTNQISRFMIQSNRGNVYQLGSEQFPLVIRIVRRHRVQPTIAGSMDIAAFRRPSTSFHSGTLLVILTRWSSSWMKLLPHVRRYCLLSELPSVSLCLAEDHATPGDVKRASPFYRQSLYQPASENRIWSLSLSTLADRSRIRGYARCASQGISLQGVRIPSGLEFLSSIGPLVVPQAQVRVWRGGRSWVWYVSI
jgi:hypothetical protein